MSSESSNRQTRFGRRGVRAVGAAFVSPALQRGVSEPEIYPEFCGKGQFVAVSKNILNAKTTRKLSNGRNLPVSK